MNTPAPLTTDCDAMLGELAAMGMRAARVVSEMIEIEGRAAALVASWLPETAGPAVSSDAVLTGQTVDAVEAAMAGAVPRVEALARALERISRSVRRSLALRQRMRAGWPRVGSADDRRSMVRRQVARGVAEVIRREADGEAAERLFDELAERLDDPAIEQDLELPVPEIVRRICGDLGLAVAGVVGVADGRVARSGFADTG